MYPEEEEDRPEWEIEPEEEKEGTHLSKIGPTAGVLLVTLVIAGALALFLHLLESFGSR